MYLIGSRAVAQFIDKKIKDDTDWDLVLEDGETAPEGADICPTFPDKLPLLRLASLTPQDSPYGPLKVPDGVCLMLLKKAHLHRNLGFEKHIRDYHALKTLFSDKVTDMHLSATAELRRQTIKAFGDRTPSLNKSKSDFFDDYVTKVYDHDDIHRATCYGDTPLFERLKPAGENSVWCSKSLWGELSHEDKIKCVREEGFVIAIERFLLPAYLAQKPVMPQIFAFDKAITKICTTLTSGWFREFAQENWPEIIKCDYDFWGKFKVAQKDLVKV